MNIVRILAFSESTHCITPAANLEPAGWLRVCLVLPNLTIPATLLSSSHYFAVVLGLNTAVDVR